VCFSSSACVVARVDRLTRPCSSLAQAISIDQVAEQRATGDPEYDPDRDACVVCLDGPKSHIFVPCGHQCVCFGCGALIMGRQPRACPLCKLPSKSLMRVFRN